MNPAQKSNLEAKRKILQKQLQIKDQLKQDVDGVLLPFLQQLINQNQSYQIQQLLPIEEEDRTLWKEMLKTESYTAYGLTANQLFVGKRWEVPFTNKLILLYANELEGSSRYKPISEFLYTYSYEHIHSKIETILAAYNLSVEEVLIANAYKPFVVSISAHALIQINWTDIMGLDDWLVTTKDFSWMMWIGFDEEIRICRKV